MGRRYTFRGRVGLTLMLNQRLAQSRLFVCQVRQPRSHSPNLIVILAKLGMSESLLKPETPVGDFAALAPKAITFLADFEQHFVCCIQFIPALGLQP